MTMNGVAADPSSRSYSRAWLFGTVLTLFAIFTFNVDTRMMMGQKAPDETGAGNGASTRKNNAARAVAQNSGYQSVGPMTPFTNKKIKLISILGERNSGTRWLNE